MSNNKTIKIQNSLSKEDIKNLRRIKLHDWKNLPNRIIKEFHNKKDGDNLTPPLINRIR